MTSTLFTILHVPFPASSEHISSYTKIRLTALTTNPETFNGSTFGRDSAYTPEIWRSRVSTNERTTLAAIKMDDKEDWIGTLSVLCPETLLNDIKSRISYPYPPEIKEGEEDGVFDVYMLVGMWVHPEYRGLGVGRTLIEHALEVVKSGSSSAANGEEKEKKKVVLLQLRKNNEPAKKLYEKAGFARQEGGLRDGEDIGGIEWMFMTVN